MFRAYIHPVSVTPNEIKVLIDPSPNYCPTFYKNFPFLAQTIGRGKGKTYELARLDAQRFCDSKGWIYDWRFDPKDR